jgi:exosome complex exonuclease RRP6
MSKENTGNSMDALLEEYAPILKNLIRYSSAVNAKDISFYKSIDSSIRDTANDINSELIDSMNDILMSALTVSNDNTENLRFKDDFEQENNQILSNILDTLLERVEINIDNHYKAKKNKKYAKSIVNTPVQSGDEYTYLDKSDASNTNNNNTNYNNIPKSNSNMEKPQSKFLNKIDNFETSPFKPLINIKPNAMQPLNESLQLIESTDEIPEHYENPYSYEIMNSEYPEWILSEVPDDAKYQSIPWDGSPEAQWIDSPEKLDSLLIELNKCKVIAIDLEHHDYRTYHGLTSLMQITTDTKQDYLIDPLSPTLRPHLTILNEVFTNPSIIKVLHGAFMDVIWLQRDLGLYLVSLFDTFHAAKQLALGKYSLAYLLEEYVRFRTSKKWQLADWRIRPLSSEMMDYAKADTHFLIEIFYKMHEDLLKIPNALQKALYASRKVACRRFEYSTYRPKNLSMSSNNKVVTTTASVPLIDEITNKITLNYDRDLPWTNLIFSNNIPLEKRPLLEILFKWRDNEARKEDESPRFIMSDFLLVSLVNTFQIGQEDNINVNSVMAVINKTSKFSGSYYVRKVINDLTEVIKNALVELKGIDLNKLLTTIDKSSKNDEFIVTTNNNETNNIDLYETVKDVNKLKENFGNFMNFYNRTISGSKDSNIATIQSSNENDIFAIEYNKEGKINIIKNKSIGERINEVVTFFNKDMDKNVEFEIDEEDIVGAEEEEEEGHEVETAETDNEPIAGSQNEIITLRKKNKNGPVKKRKADDLSTSEDLSVNFSKTIMEKEDEGNNRRDRFKRQKQQKKPSFDPYSRDLLSDMNIPQLKKKKMIDRGKNVVFKQKK